MNMAQAGPMCEDAVNLVSLQTFMKGFYETDCNSLLMSKPLNGSHPQFRCAAWLGPHDVVLLEKD